VTDTGRTIEELQEVMGYRFCDASLLDKAVTHSSAKPAGGRSYERLEFLGDAVLGLVVAERLFGLSGRFDEGQMTQMKSAVVSRRSAAEAGHRLRLQHYLRADRGLAQAGEYPLSVLAAAYEALVGAIYLDGGFEKARDFVVRTLEPELKAAERRDHAPSFKSLLQEFVQAEGQEPPAYRVICKVGPPHDRLFVVVVSEGGVEKGFGWGKSKKEAEQHAAEEALSSMYPQWWQRDDLPRHAARRQ
jgi:ribonuclease-3